MRTTRRLKKEFLRQHVGKGFACIFILHIVSNIQNVIWQERPTLFRDSVVDSTEFSSEANHLVTQLPQDALIIEPFHGLGNRLRAYGSAAALARKTNRSLIVVWISDVHVNASMTELFQTRRLTIIDMPIHGLVSKIHKDCKMYDYNSPGGKDEVIKDFTASPIYVRSAYVLQSHTRVTEAEIAHELRVLVPVRAVQRRIDDLKLRLPSKRNLVGVHIRMVTDITVDVPGIERVPEWHPASAAHMGQVLKERSRCHYANFVPHIDQAIERKSDSALFVASDSPNALSALRLHYGKRIITSDPEELDGCQHKLKRQSVCLQLCLAEFLFLSTETSSLILSGWSSASELILRLGGQEVPHKSGCVSKSTTWHNMMSHLV
jgi:hypothetical protein